MTTVDHETRHFLSYWRHALNSESGLMADTALCAIGQAEESVVPYLEKWCAMESPTAFRQAISFLESNEDELISRRLCNPFWNERPVQMREAAAWAVKKEFLDYSTKAIGTRGNPERRLQAARIIRFLRGLSGQR